MPQVFWTTLLGRKIETLAGVKWDLLGKFIILLFTYRQTTTGITCSKSLLAGCWDQITIHIGIHGFYFLNVTLEEQEYVKWY